MTATASEAPTFEETLDKIVELVENAESKGSPMLLTQAVGEWVELPPEFARALRVIAAAVRENPHVTFSMGATVPISDAAELYKTTADELWKLVTAGLLAAVPQEPHVSLEQLAAVAEAMARTASAEDE